MTADVFAGSGFGSAKSSARVKLPSLSLSRIWNAISGFKRATSTVKSYSASESRPS